MEISAVIFIAIPIIVGVVVGFLRHKGQVALVQRCTRKFHDENWRIRRDLVYDLSRELTRFRRYNSRHLVKLLLMALRDEDWRVRMLAATTLEQELDAYLPHGIFSKPAIRFSSPTPVISPSVKPLVVKAFIRIVGDPHPDIRKEAVIALGKAHDAVVVSCLLKALGDDEESVRQYAAKSLEIVCEHVHTIVFNRRRDSEPSNQEHTVRNPDVSNLTIPMKNLRQIIIDATTCDIQQVEAFASYGTTYLDSTYLKSLVTITISGDPTIFSGRVYELCGICKDADVAVETIIFGTTPSTKSPSPRTIYNPDMSAFTLPMPHVRQVSIYTDTYNFHQVERFLTYAVNYMGQKHLKKQVDVHIYGDPEKLHQNLRNNLTHLCKRVHLHKEDKLLIPRSV